MSSQASSAGGGEAKVRQKLVETGDVDVMVAIRSNFFYTRTVPCELWFLNRDKPEAHRDKVLMIDARNIYRKVTRKIYDWSPEQQQNLLAIVWLYRSQTEKYLDLVSGYCRRTLYEGAGCFSTVDESGETIHPLAIERVRRIASRNYLTNVEMIRSDCATGLPDGSIDVALLYDVFHKLSDPDSVLEELHRVLTPDGILSFSDHHVKEDAIMFGVADKGLFRLAGKGKKTYSFSIV